MAQTQTADAVHRDGPEGIGGWLILPVIGLLLTPIQGVVQLFEYGTVADSWPLLTGPQQAFLIVEILGNIAISIVLPVVLLVLLFNKKTGFPRLYVIWAVANIVFLLADLVVAQALFGAQFEASGTDLIDGETLQSILRAFVLMAIWVPYMLNAKRVRNTFIR